MKEISKDHGLEISLNKIRVLIFNSKQKYNEIEWISVEKELKYLDVKIENRRDMFNGYKKEVMVKGKRLECMTYSIVEKS